MNSEKSKMNQKNLPISKFGLNKGCLITSFNKTIFTKGLLVFHNKISLILNRVLLNTSKKHSNFHIFLILCL
jgi:hypothetical protein